MAINLRMAPNMETFRECFFSYLAVHLGCLNILSISNTHSTHKPPRSVNLRQRKSQGRGEGADKADAQDTVSKE